MACNQQFKSLHFLSGCWMHHFDWSSLRNGRKWGAVGATDQLPWFSDQLQSTSKSSNMVKRIFLSKLGLAQQTAKFCTIEMKIPTSAAKTVNSSQLLYALSFSAQTSRKLGNVCSVEYLVMRLKFVSRERTSYCSPCNYEPVTLSLCVCTTCC